MKFSNISHPIKNLFEHYIGSLSDAERKKIIGYVYIILTLVTVSFFGLFAISPTLSTISNLKKQYEDNKLIYEALNKKLSNLALLDIQYGSIQPDLPVIYNAIPETTRIPQLTRQLESIAEENGVSLISLDFGTIEIFPNVKRDPIYSFTFVINIEGSQGNVINFLTDLIAFDRIVGIDRIATGTNKENRYKAEITGRAYFSNRP